MGILYQAVTTTNQLKRKLKAEFVLDRLKALNVTHSKTGKSIHDMDYEELKYELVLASFREIDTENSEQAWF